MILDLAFFTVSLLKDRHASDTFLRPIHTDRITAAVFADFRLQKCDSAVFPREGEQRTRRGISVYNHRKMDLQICCSCPHIFFTLRPTTFTHLHSSLPVEAKGAEHEMSISLDQAMSKVMIKKKSVLYHVLRRECDL